MRVCSLLPSATEIAFALGLGDSVVAVTHECDYPPEAKKKRVVVKSVIDAQSNSSHQINEAISERLRAGKSIYTIDLPAFKAADPELILTQELCDVCAVDYNEVLEASRLLSQRPKIISLNPSLLSDVLREIEYVGHATGREKEAAALVRHLKERVDQVENQASRSDLRPRVACLEWLDPIYNAGHWVPEMVELAGGQEGLAQKGRPSRQINWDEVLDFAPEVMVLMPCGFDVKRASEDARLLCALPGWKELPAVKQGKVFAVNGHAYFSRSGPRLVDGLEILGQLIHPEIFPWQASPEAARKLE